MKLIKQVMPIFVVIFLASCLCLFKHKHPPASYVNNIRSTYKISTYHTIGPIKIKLFCGSAIAISEDRLITARHVLSSPDTNLIEVEIYSTNGVYMTSLEAKVLRDNEDMDLTELILTQKQLPYYYSQKLEANADEIGDSVYLVGCSMGFLPADIRSGFISSKFAPYCPGWWSASTTASSGDSGCGIFDTKTNKLLGIVLAKYGAGDEVWSTGFISTDKVINFLAD